MNYDHDINTVSAKAKEASELTRRITVERDQYSVGDTRRFGSYVLRWDDDGLPYVRAGRGGSYKGYVTGVRTSEYTDFVIHVFTITPHWEKQTPNNDHADECHDCGDTLSDTCDDLVKETGLCANCYI